MKSPVVPISWGELYDKISILEIKSSKIIEHNSVLFVKKELDALIEIGGSLLKDNQKLAALFNDLCNINLKLWDIEDAIREQERQRDFGQKFVDLARSVYFENDKRAKIKANINLLLESDIHEVKSYKSY